MGIGWVGRGRIVDDGLKEEMGFGGETDIEFNSPSWFGGLERDDDD